MPTEGGGGERSSFIFIMRPVGVPVRKPPSTDPRGARLVGINAGRPSSGSIALSRLLATRADHRSRQRAQVEHLARPVPQLLPLCAWTTLTPATSGRARAVIAAAVEATPAVAEAAAAAATAAAATTAAATAVAATAAAATAAAATAAAATTAATSGGATATAATSAAAATAATAAATAAAATTAAATTAATSGGDNGDGCDGGGCDVGLPVGRSIGQYDCRWVGQSVRLFVCRSVSRSLGRSVGRLFGRLLLCYGGFGRSVGQ